MNIVIRFEKKILCYVTRKFFKHFPKMLWNTMDFKYIFDTMESAGFENWSPRFVISVVISEILRFDYIANRICKKIYTVLLTVVYKIFAKWKLNWNYRLEPIVILHSRNIILVHSLHYVFEKQKCEWGLIKIIFKFQDYFAVKKAWCVLYTRFSFFLSLYITVKNSVCIIHKWIR